MIRLWWLALALLLGGCAGLPSAVDRPHSVSRPAAADAPLPSFVREAALPATMSGFRALPQASFALDARLQLMRRAAASLDMQTYLLADDSTGRLMLRELAAAAARGVRVRLLLDDFYTEGLDELLLGLAARPNIEIRVFNPFAYGRDETIARLWHFATDFHRLNHRMHNKLFVADGALALVGGRNLADEYFLRSDAAYFIDFELLIAGPVVPELSASFDTYWNSEQVYPLRSVARPRLADAELRAAFERRVTPATAPDPDAPAANDAYGDPPLGMQIDGHRPRFVTAVGGALADRPEKITGADAETVTERYFSLLREAQSEVILISPYFVPGREGVERLRELRARDITVRVITNSTSTTDEPIVNIGFGRYQRELLQMGVTLYEVESVRLRRDERVRGLLGRTAGRLHAKLALIDRKLLLVGSMNVDPRSSRTNTEIGVGVRSEELTQRVLSFYRLDLPEVVYEVRLKADGRTIEWVGHDQAREETTSISPGTGWLQRLRLFLFGLFVPEDLL